ncbi:Alkylated DNA repair protein ALKBH8 homolog (Alpha-ketoglutarate-dependent dioxygenase ALKBH8 homolog) (AtALKBH8) [Durusdinium trenchii]|uniref:Alkylated DNA repair protein ALKBH8 homolog (Alpha-ketoglutarate-dependent dioxygenase ALKBH8 homolog) (AtALKBH8) n=1 Tax=Durusdinium trenchii TaxID=1381693 RepID=A0ABP0MX13_9DINO
MGLSVSINASVVSNVGWQCSMQAAAASARRTLSPQGQVRSAPPYLPVLCACAGGWWRPKRRWVRACGVKALQRSRESQLDGPELALRVGAESAQNLVPGLRLWPDFLSEEEGKRLAEYLDQNGPSWKKEQFGVPTLYHVKHFGALGSLRPRLVRLPDPTRGEFDLPEEGILAEVSARLASGEMPWSSVLKGFIPNEANVNDYSRSEGSKLLMHWDDRGLYEEPVCSVTVLGECIMTFRPSGRSNFKSTSAEEGEGPSVRLLVPERSLLVLKGAARYEWQHGIPEPENFLSERRVAIIFRRVRGIPSTESKCAQAEDAALEKGGKGADIRAGKTQQHALVISSNWPDPDVSAAGRVTAGRLQMLRRLCAEDASASSAVTFASPARPGNSKGKLSAANGVNCIRIKLNDEASVMSALEAAGHPELVLFDGFNTEERFGHYVHQALPDAMRVLDMQDFHALRLGRERLIAAGVGATAVASFRPPADDEDLQRELASIHRCDATLAISEEERTLLVERYGIPSWKVCAAPFGFSNISDERPSFSRRDGALFIGNWRHRPNRDCARWLVKEVWPLVRQEVPDAVLNVYGANQTPEDAALDDPACGARVRGYCRSVESAMKSHKLLVAPLRFGAGVKGKVLEAMLHGLVVVTTPVGIEGIAPEREFPGYVVQNGGEDAQAFADVIVLALRDRHRWEVLQKVASGFIAEHFDEKWKLPAASGAS